LLAHDIAYSKHVAGVSGTTNPDALPSTLTENIADDKPSEVLGETIMLMQQTTKKLDTPVKVYKDPMQNMIEIASNIGNKAIINIGESFSGTNHDVINQIIEALQSSKINRDIVYLAIDPDSQEKMTYVRNPQDNLSAKIFQKGTESTLIDPIYYFSPSDTRGTDFKIPSGTGVVIPGATTTLQDLLQGIWRLRKLGTGHSVEFALNEALSARVKTRVNASEIQSAHIFTDHLLETAASDGQNNLKLQSIEPSSNLVFSFIANSNFSKASSNFFCSNKIFPILLIASE
jgi:hypothetical protein